MPKYGYLIVEGPHDVELVYRLLNPYGLQRVKKLEELDEFFKPLVPKQYPPGGDLLKRVPVPLFLQAEGYALAVHSAGGESRLVSALEETGSQLNGGLQQFTGIGFLLDSDSQKSAEDRYKNIKDEFAKKTGLALQAEPGKVELGPPRVGAYVLPDNTDAGTLEDLLLDAAEYVYPNLLGLARRHVGDALKCPELTAKDLEEINKPAGCNKAVIGAMSSIFRPGKAVQVSIQDNRWLAEETLSLPRIAALQTFLITLLDLDSKL